MFFLCYSEAGKFAEHTKLLPYYKLIRDYFAKSNSPLKKIGGFHKNLGEKFVNICVDI